MEKTLVNEKRSKSPGSCKTRDTVEIREDRYESLKSLGRLLEYDLETEIHSSRQIGLPVIDVNSIPKTEKPRRRNSSVMDYMHKLKSVRRNMLQRLLPRMNNTTKQPSVKEIAGASIKPKGWPTQIKQRYDIVINTMYTPCEELDSSRNNTPNDKTDSEDDLADSVENLRKRIARFEALKNIRRSAHADDFQQYLGERYLEAYHRRTRNLELGRANTTLDYVSNLDNRIASQLNAKSCESITYHDLKAKNDSRSYLPSVTKRQRHGKGRRNSRHNDASARRRRVMLGYSDMEYEFSISNNTTGIPHHAAKRAHMRYFHSHGLNSILQNLQNTEETTKDPQPDNIVASSVEDQRGLSMLNHT